MDKQEENQRLIQKDEGDDSESPPTASIFSAYDDATTGEKQLFYFGLFFAFVCGATIPVTVMFTSSIVEKINPNYTIDERVEKIRDTAWNILICMGIISVTGFIWMRTMTHLGKTIANRYRVKYYRAIMNNKIAWFDESENQEFTAKFTIYTNSIEGGIGRDLGKMVFQFSVFVSGVFFCFYHGYKISVIVGAMVPTTAYATYLFGKSMIKNMEKNQKAYIRAGAVAEETFGSIKTITALNAQDHRIQTYEGQLTEAKEAGINTAVSTGLGLGSMALTSFMTIAVCFYIGYLFCTHEVHNIRMDRDYRTGDILGAVFSTFFGFMYLGMAVNGLNDIFAAKIALFKVTKVIEEANHAAQITYAIDTEAKLGDVEGNFEFIDVDFRYPSRLEAPVFEKLNLTIPSKKTTAIVGETGSGKSTIVQLIEKFYEPDAGKLLFGGIDTATIAPEVLRSKIALVSQEPVLFATSILENLKIGAPEASTEEIVKAAKRANAHEFIMHLPEGFETNVGSGGSQLSGGQKQRIAIARALLKNPLVLVLDEATSALDNQSEREVQDAIQGISGGMTQIVIAHRLSTIRSADQICVIKEKGLYEQGTHDELVSQNGAYANLWRYQHREGQNEEEDRSLALMVDEDTVSRHDSSSATSESFSRISMDYAETKQPGASGTERKEEEDKEDGIFGRLLEMNSPEKRYLILGGIASVVVGACHPVTGLLAGKWVDGMLDWLDPDASDANAREQIRWCCAGIAVSALFIFIGYYVSQLCFSVAGEQLTFRLRLGTLRSILKMPMSFFDQTENSSGALCASLENDSRNMSAMVGFNINVMLQSIAAMVTGVTLALFYSWRIAILLLIISPIFALQAMVDTGSEIVFGETEDDIIKELGGMVSESVTNIRVVRSFTAEKRLINFYDSRLGERKVGIKDWVKGAVFGIAVGAPCFAQFVSFYTAAELVDRGIGEFRDILIALLCFVFAGFGAGRAGMIAPDMEQSKRSARNIFKLMDTESKLDPFSTKGSSLAPHTLQGNFEFNQVYFRYATRRHVVLRGIDMSIEKGQSVAFVGPSGCGKSTTIQLIMRFYRPSRGEITLDNRPISEYNLRDFRGQLGLVSQEPVLFDTTIIENIRYGNRSATDEEIKEATIKANAWEFIEHDSEGLNRRVGQGGRQLSGGQRQRVAIARAIVGKPNILLLDEATSALDNQAEKIVQDALDKIMIGKTTIVIAHKIATIQHCDNIFVFQNGRIVEKGTHNELLKKDGAFASLAKVDQ